MEYNFVGLWWRRMLDLIRNKIVRRCSDAKSSVHLLKMVIFKLIHVDLMVAGLVFHLFAY